MNWKQLLSAKRWGYESRHIADQHDARSEFQRDYDRLIFSSPFRRLQNKTQVFPLPGSVFVHNRLTHSLEVASVGRSLGRIFYNETRKSFPTIDADVPYLQEVGNIVSAACLSHDLGNPAFGHSGEAAISSYFTDGSGQTFKNRVSPEEWADLTHFEGNANALRILTHAFSGKDEHGFALTYSTLGAIVKYPCAAIDGHDKFVHHRKKYGFFQSEQPAFKKIAEELGLFSENGQQIGYKRHPLVYLVEAADDICYNIIDLEDAHRLGILSYEEVANLLLPICGDNQLRGRLEGLGDSDSRISLLRAKAINTLIVACANAFVQHQEAILRGQFDRPLMDALAGDLVAGMGAIARVSVEKIYNAQSVVQIEVAGYKVMNGLLEEFIPAYLSKKKTKYDSKLLALMPKQFHTNQETTYARVRSVLDFVSGMTDLYAVELYRKIKGISFPSLD
ncbi:deoxyguanosinetriphosphate triphosphohydrolase [Parapedobacter sp. 10938]|uniref:deoxyguanosinetriphosphate triphosphohydrolase n=1 Tax=Parapedobacter flavus TaxID=3110225 RepID=UPI002DBEF1EE|nr:deoxyguanosinetriphosphate triphosphohydrolase [Parapedobacter sp. 10938]MEC3881579.1 deoxyguanosinetriphosphate triphosphohydrolase [Parapedobacter sp. 10938]